MTDRPPRRRPLRRVLISVLALAAPTALTAGLSTGTVGPAPTAAAADDDPPFTLSVPKRRVAYGGKDSVWDDLGIRLVGGDRPTELWLQRSSYDKKITVTWKDPDGDPAGDVVIGRNHNKLTRLQKFIVLDVDPVGPRKPFRLVRGGCIGGDSQRVRPDASPTSPFPGQCGYNFNPFATGTVQGLQAGHAGSAMNPYGSLPIGRGRYDVTVRIGDKWADAFGLSQAERTAKQRLVVRGYDGAGKRQQRQVRAAERTADPASTPARRAPSPSAAVTPDELPEDTPLPDLRALPAWGMQIAPNGNFLQFSATVWNAGDSPLVVDGFRRPDRAYMDGYQYFFDPDGTQRPEYVAVGGFEWDPKPTHLHWHFQSFARYTLVPHGHDPDHGDPGHHSKSRKEAFCLAPTDAVDLTVEGADVDNEEVDLGSACGDRDSRAIREVLQSGWGDTYAQFRAGQSFNLKGLPNGCYDVIVEGNPAISGSRILVESDYTNNSYKRKVCIGGKLGARKIRSIEPIGIITEGSEHFPR